MEIRWKVNIQFQINFSSSALQYVPVAAVCRFHRIRLIVMVGMGREFSSPAVLADG